jgi:hypothetical protein
MLLKLLQVKVTTGARAAKVKSSRSVTAAIKAAVFHPLSLMRVNQRRFISVVASSQRMAFCVMAAITLFEAFTQRPVIF